MKTKQKTSLKKIDIYTFRSHKKEEYLVKWFTKFITKIYQQDYSVYSHINGINLDLLDKSLWSQVGLFIPHHKLGEDIKSPIVLADKVIGSANSDSLEIRGKGVVFLCGFNIGDFIEVNKSSKSNKFNFLENIKDDLSISRLAVVLFGDIDRDSEREGDIGGNKAVDKMDDLLLKFKDNFEGDVGFDIHRL
jgi:hypothetical protein